MQFLVNPLEEYFLIISHSITYGVYQKTVKKKLSDCLTHVHTNKVMVLLTAQMQLPSQARV